MARRELYIWEHLKFCHFQPVHCASKYPISPKVFNRFSKSLPQLEDVEGGHLGGMFQVPWYFSFAMARWKLFASTKLEIFSLSSCTLCQQKSYISKGIQPILEIFASSRRSSGWAFGWKVSGAQVAYFCNARWKLCAWTTFEILQLSTCTLRLQKSSISKGIQPFLKSLPQLEDFEGGHLVGKFQVRRYFTFAMAKWKVFASITFENLSLSTCTLCQQKSYISKGIHRFSKSLPQLEDVEGEHLGWKFLLRSYFTFALARWKLCASTTFQILPLSTCTLCQQKSYISKGI